jgi:tetratricopeptide (TPR) repeat protein
LTRRASFAAAAVLGAAAGCTTAPPPEDPTAARVRAAAARADAAASEGRLREALDAYREALTLAPGDARLAAREREVKDALVARRVEEVDEDLRNKDVSAARRAAISILEIDPQIAAGYRALARAAEAEGALEDAWTAARRAHEIDPDDPALTESLAVLATKTGRWAEAEVLYERLAQNDPAFREKAMAARVEFRVQNLPATARRAALSPRLTRAQLATLLVWLSPDVRDARVPAGTEVAIDAVDRPERAALVRAIGLGFFTVSRETHLVGADTAVTRAEFGSHLRRLAALGGSEPACAAWASPAALAECGILPEGPKLLSGRDAVAAIDATLRLTRPGGSR